MQKYCQIRSQVFENKRRLNENERKLQINHLTKRALKETREKTKKFEP